MSDNLQLFRPKQEAQQSLHAYRPLADRLRPDLWDDFQGLDELDKNLVAQLKAGRGNAPSLILWGPPGSGKTTLARLIGGSFDCHFVQFSAVLGGVKQVREIIAQAKKIPMQTLLFVDEIHRFNKAQQDAFLPHVENGTIVLIGATTENPSFYLNSALLSRARVLPLPLLSESAQGNILTKALSEIEINFDQEAQKVIIGLAGGDARRLLNFLEAFCEATQDKLAAGATVSAKELKDFLKDGGSLLYDRSGDEHYNMASAFIKSMRGSDPDAALYWAFRMIEGGEDPRFIIRRMMIFASEDISNADPRAIQVAVATSDAYEKLGLPEGRIPIAQCIAYLACAPKSNRSYKAMHAALAAIKEDPEAIVPLHLRNAPTKLMKELDYGKDYQYPHDSAGAHVAGVQYLPDKLKDRVFYQPSERGYEQRMKERLDHYRGKSS